MARQPRWNLPDPGVFHVTSRGVDGCAIFHDDDDRSVFWSLLRRAELRYRWRLLAFCLMDNHFHLITLVGVERLSLGMHFLNGRYAQIFNQTHERRGHLFGGRFRVRVVRNDQHLSAACDYVLDNRVRAGLVRHRDDWPWLGGEYAR